MIVIPGRPRLRAGEPGIRKVADYRRIPGSREGAPRNDGVTASGTPLQRAAQIMRDFADDTAAEGQDADHEDHALDHGAPLPEAGEILLHGDDDESADHRTEHRAEPADQRHEHDLAPPPPAP